jgi:hypothetical protein
MTKSREELAADWLTSTGAVSEMGAWKLEQSLIQLLTDASNPDQREIEHLRGAIRSLCNGYKAWDDAEKKPWSDIVWQERQDGCRQWHDAYEAARAVLSSAAPTRTLEEVDARDSLAYLEQCSAKASPGKEGNG